MTATETRSVVVEKELPFPADRIWRALTQPHLMAEWLMNSDFAPKADHSFQFRTEWGAIDCRVLEIEPQTTLAYSWVARGLDSVVTWTLTPTGGGTHLRMEQTGFTRDRKDAYGGAMVGWRRFFDRLETTLTHTQ